MNTELKENQGNYKRILESLVQDFHNHFTSRTDHLVEQLTIGRKNKAVEVPVSNDYCQSFSHTYKGDFAINEYWDDVLFSVNGNAKQIHSV